MAGRQGFSGGAFRNLNKDRHFQRNSHKAKDLPFSDGFADFRLFARVFGLFPRNDTRNDTRPEGLRRSSRLSLCE
jgi:hypothetical protein